MKASAAVSDLDFPTRMMRAEIAEFHAIKSWFARFGQRLMAAIAKGRYQTAMRELEIYGVDVEELRRYCREV